MTTSYAVYDLASGRILYTTSGRTETPVESVDAGHGVLTIPSELEIGVNEYQVANPGTDQAQLTAFIATLAELKAAKDRDAWGYFTRLFQMPNGFTYGGKLFQLDDASRANISAGVNDALTTKSDPVAYPFQIPAWIAADNSPMALAGPDAMIAFGRACLVYFQGCRVHFRSIKNAIAAAADQTALDAIDVTAGYPTPSA